MDDALYARHPAVYDALYDHKEYDAEVAFVLDRFDRLGDGGDRVLVVGCGTGEHTRRLVDQGFDVTAVDKHEAMVERARTKVDADFRVDALPDLAATGPFDLVLVPFTVVNHLAPDELAPAVSRLADVLADDGVLVFDCGDDWSDLYDAWVRTSSGPGGDYARVGQVEERDGNELRWHSLVFTPDGDWFVDAHDLTAFPTDTVLDALADEGFSVETFGAYDVDEADGTGVFVATR